VSIAIKKAKLMNNKIANSQYVSVYKHLLNVWMYAHIGCFAVCFVKHVGCGFEEYKATTSSIFLTTLFACLDLPVHVLRLLAYKFYIPYIYWVNSCRYVIGKEGKLQKQTQYLEAFTNAVYKQQSEE
jgi:hypothetical protein